jgi:endonuclease YncB( thermonuclease family)
LALDKYWSEVQRAVMRRPRFLASLAILAMAAGAIYLMRGAPQREITGAAEAIDGDSLRLAGEEIRLKGIDAPELSQTCMISNRATTCGRDARAHLRRMLASGLATCIGEGRDRYGRLLARCRVRGVDVNAAMVRDGYAIAFGDFSAEEAEAKAGYRGLWAGTFERPGDWRARNGNTSN